MNDAKTYITEMYFSNEGDGTYQIKKVSLDELHAKPKDIRAKTGIQLRRHGFMIVGKHSIKNEARQQLAKFIGHNNAASIDVNKTIYFTGTAGEIN